MDFYENFIAAMRWLQNKRLLNDKNSSVVVFLAYGTGATSSYWSTNLTIHGHMLKRTIFSKTPTSTLLNISTSSPSANPHYNITTCINASLQQCAINKNLKRGQQLHARLLITGLSSSSPSCTTSLINITADYARNVFAYNALISGFILNGLPKDGLGSL
uniref:Uncharacterized protein n=1 Tax=Salix viminalis TaxID=40686 RepID=A0A6N2KKP7_SALVM